jgi:hypothetical protein
VSTTGLPSLSRIARTRYKLDSLFGLGEGRSAQAVRLPRQHAPGFDDLSTISSSGLTLRCRDGGSRLAAEAIVEAAGETALLPGDARALPQPFTEVRNV